MPHLSIAAARACRSSATLRRFGKTQAFRYPDVNSEIVAAILLSWPAAAECAHMMSQFIADAQSLGGGHLPFLLGPATLFERGDRAPVAASEGDDVLFAH